MGEFHGVPRESTRESPTMIRMTRICRKCGAKIFSDAPEALCARCVLKSALSDFAGGSAAGGGDPGHAASSMPATTPNDVAPASKKTARAVELLGELGDY